MPQIFVQGEALHAVEVSPETTVAALKGALAPVEGIATANQVVTYGGVPLEDDCVLVEAVQEQGTLSVTARLVGGEYSLPYSFCVM